MPAPNTPWAARISAYSPTRPTHTQVPVPHYGLRRSSTPSPNAKIRSTGARPRGLPAGGHQHSTPRSTGYATPSNAASIDSSSAATSIRRRALRATQHRRTRLPSTQAVARHRNPLRQIRPDLPRQRPAGLRRHPRPSGNSEIGRHALAKLAQSADRIAARQRMQRSLAQLVATCEHPAPTGTAPIERRISESFAASRSTRRSPIAQSMTRPSPPRPGSPTLPVDGEDPFAEAVLTASVSCRLYPTDTGGTPADRCTPATGGEFPNLSADRLARRRLPRNPTERTIHPHHIAGVRNSPPPVGQQ